MTSTADPKIHTDKEIAKMAGVGTGTVARFNKVMDSGDEELKKKLIHIHRQKILELKQKDKNGNLRTKSEANVEVYIVATTPPTTILSPKRRNKNYGTKFNKQKFIKM